MTLKRTVLWIVVGFIVLMLAALIFSTSWAWF
jgi:hypothetical protein